MADQSVRVTAKGDFTQLQRGLKQLQGDLKNVTGEIDRGARKGGFFDDSQIRALDFFGKRFKSTLQELKDAMAEQGHAFERLLSMARNAHGAERDAIQKEIDYRSKVIDQIEEQLQQMEKVYRQRKKESSEFDNKSGKESDSSGGGSSGKTSGTHDFGGNLLNKVLGGGKLLLGMAGIGGLVSMFTESYKAAYDAATIPLDLAQRMRGNGRSGGARSQWDVSGGVGRDDNMGYSTAESWQFLDMYSRQVGGVNPEEQRRLMKFGRGYGLNTGEVSGLVGDNVHSGGGQGSKFADAIAGSVAKTGMTPRIVEVMEANNALLKSMNTTLKDGSAQQILAYQTALDKIGNEKGMTQITGSNGANVISGLGGIFRPGEENWKWMGIRALQQYNPKKYGNMNLFGLEQANEDGLMNPDNVAAMAQYTKSISGGNKDIQKRIAQKWLTDGGFGATKRQASELWDGTNGFEDLSPDKLQKYMNGSIDSGAGYDANRKGEAGQGYLQTDSRFQAAMEGIGQPIVTAVQGLKEGITTGMEKVAGFVESTSGGVDGILSFMRENMTGLAMDSNLIGLLSIFSPSVQGAKEAYKTMYGEKAPDWLTNKNQLDPKNKDFFRDDARWTGEKMPTLDPKLSEEERSNQKALYEWLTQQEHKSKVDNATKEDKKKADDIKKRASEAPWYDTNELGNNIGDRFKEFFSGLFYIWSDAADKEKKATEEQKKTTINGMQEMTASLENFRKGATTIMLASYMGGANGSGGGTGLRMASFGSPGTGGGGGMSFDGRADFVKKMLPYATVASQRTSLPIDFILGQWGHESGWGSSDAAKRNNNFAGIKPWGNTGAGDNSTYAGYGSIGDFANGYADFYQKNGRYKGLLDAAKRGASSDELANMIGRTGYAEDPAYVTKLQGSIGGVDSLLNNEEMAKPLLNTGSGLQTASAKHESTVNVHLTGDGANQLASMSKEKLVQLIKSTWTEQERQKKLTNPTRTVMA